MAVVCLGEDPTTEKPGDLDELAMDVGQLSLVRRLAATGLPLVLVLVTGRPRVLQGIEKLPQVSAVVQSFLPGPFGGQALAEVLFGVEQSMYCTTFRTGVCEWNGKGKALSHTTGIHPCTIPS